MTVDAEKYSDHFFPINYGPTTLRSLDTRVGKYVGKNFEINFAPVDAEKFFDHFFPMGYGPKTLIYLQILEI